MPTNRKHQNNFATNLTSNQTSGVTTTPLNSIPSVAAPFSIALDATNLNGKYEVVEVTSKTATNINHAATTYAHTTAEEVRMVVGATELDEFASAVNGGAPIKEYAPQGFLQNGKISVLDSAGITVAIKTLAGTDPSSSDPVYVRIGDTIRTISSALSVSKADGTNWFNAGSAELATKEIDYFVYLGYNATDGVTIGFARIPGANQYSDFSATTTDEKYCAISTITNAASTDYYENIGRFAATLSAGAGYTWSVPTYTALNLIQRPIYETRWNLVKSVLAGFSAITSETISYKVIGNAVFIESVGNLGGTSNATTFTLTLPFKAGSTVGTKNLMSSNSGDAGSTLSAPSFLGITSGSASVTVGKTMANTAGGGFTASSTKWVTLSGMVIQI